MDGACATTGEQNSYRDFVGKPEGKRLQGKLRRRGEDNIKMGLE